jgi:hypothetical protein
MESYTIRDFFVNLLANRFNDEARDKRCSCVILSFLSVSCEEGSFLDISIAKCLCLVVGHSTHGETDPFSQETDKDDGSTQLPKKTTSPCLSVLHE